MREETFKRNSMASKTESKFRDKLRKMTLISSKNICLTILQADKTNPLVTIIRKPI